MGLGWDELIQLSSRWEKDGMLYHSFGDRHNGDWLAFGKISLRLTPKTGYLISSGTAICGGSAIAAVGPVIEAKSSQMSVALGVIFILNANHALFIFPPIGRALGMSQADFGLWAAIIFTTQVR